jgi:hypothetical protein
MFTSKYRDDLRVIFIVGDDSGPPTVELPEDEPQEVDLSPTIRVPSGNIESWDEAACRDAFHALAEISAIQSYPEFAIGLSLIELTYEEFNTWLISRRYSAPTFWLKETKTWRPKPGKQLTVSEIAVLNAINAIWPDGELDHKAKARDKRIQDWLTLTQQSSVKTRTIQRTLLKIHFS